MVGKNRENVWVFAEFRRYQGMGYVLLRTYGFFGTNPCPPSQWIDNAMAFEGLWVSRGMG